MSSSGSSSSGGEEAEVVLHVYDLSQGAAAALSPMLLGRRIELVPHTGVVLRGLEVFYGGGIVAMPPHAVVGRFGMRPVERLTLGRTRRSEAEVRAFLLELRPRFAPERYNLLTHNCNNVKDRRPKPPPSTAMPLTRMP